MIIFSGFFLLSSIKLEFCICVSWWVGYLEMLCVLEIGVMMNKERKKTGIIGYRSKAAAIHMIEFLSLNFVLVFYFFSSLFSFFYIFIKRNQFLCTNFVFMVYISCIWAAAGRTESKANNVKCMRITFRCEITYTLVPFIT